ncbi:MAG TPA: ATP-binding cassette domain-containing protein, partial [Spirochaetota bacterium]|nr:ATP-binding cassette domain-containing protein [Spirochaetota bacterium]
MSESTVKVKAQNLSFFYGDNQALFDINLSVQANTVMALIGPSGCGKSTFLRCINRMNDIIPYTRIEGELTIDGESIYHTKYDVTQLRRR